MTREGVRLFVGLGNPGGSYSRTRHNIGFMVIDALASAYSIPVKKEKWDLVFGRGKICDRDVILAKPMAYMNRSGPPVRRLADYYGIIGQDLLIIHDDIDLPFERLKIKMKGGHGGHNGIKSMINAFGNGDFTRLRVGVGRPDGSIDVTDHVLGRFSENEKKILEEVVKRAADAVVTILCDGIQEGMNRFNRRN